MFATQEAPPENIVKETVTSFQSPSPTYASPSRNGSISLWAGQQLPTQQEHHTEDNSDDDEVIISSNLDDMLSVRDLLFSPHLS